MMERVSETMGYVEQSILVMDDPHFPNLLFSWFLPTATYCAPT